MANKFFPMLPKLNEDAAINPDKASAWEKDAGTRDFLLALVKSLAAGGSAQNMSSIDSIPDVWARPLLFQMALYDDQRSSAQEFVQGLHDKVKGEWRALLAMLALKNVRHLVLRAEPVHLGTGTSGLEQVLAGLAPTDTVSRSTSWSDIYILHYQDRPLALTSPTTLVAPAADYQRSMAGILSQPWSADGETLCDPIPYLTADELGALYSWLQQVEQDIRQAIPTAEQDNNQACLSLFSALEAYQEDIRRRSANLSGQKIITADLGLNIGIFRCINQTVEAKAADVGDSAVRLIPSPGRGKAGDILLVSPQMVRDYAAQEGVPAAQLVVWPGLSANDVEEENLLEDRSRIGSVSLGKASFRRPEDFFTDTMTIMESSNAFAGTMKVAGVELMNSEGMSPILPLRDEILEYFTPQEIAQRTRIETLRDRTNVQFSFPLSGVNGNSEFKYTKSYPNDKINYLQSRVPVLELWPNIKREGWNKYYLYYENIEGQNVNSQELARDLFYVYPLKYGEDIGADVPEKGLSNQFTDKLTGFPEALRCTVNVDMENSVYAQQKEGGILLLNEPPAVQAIPRLEWQVGIDFGTSSTMLYYKEGGKASAPLAFDSHLLPITDSDEPIRSGRTFEDFIPSDTFDQQDGSFLSIFHMLDSSRVKTEIRPLQDGHVFWLLNRTSDVYKRNILQIDANLKWKNDDVGRRKVAAYVKQICLQSLVEAAAVGAETVKWNFSYPTAFSAEQKFAFKATCQEALQESYDGTGLTQGNSEDMIYWPESKAAAYHFNKLGTKATNFGEGAICLDIGAGTTDISIISGQPARIVYHTSIQYAGRYLFKPIYRNYELFKGETLDIGDMDEEHSNAVIDADMRENSELYLKNLKNMTGRKEIKQVLQEVQLGMAGIFCYLGSILKVLSEKDLYKEKQLPDIYVGGNGSRVFYWLCGGSFDEEAPFLDVFKEMLAVYSGLEKGYGPRIHLSVHPKVEVAGGMIEQRPHNDAEFFDEERQVEDLFGEDGRDEYIAASQLAGDTFAVKGETRNNQDFISAYDIANGVEVENVEALEKFLNEFNKNRYIWFEGVSLDEGRFHDIARHVKSHYVNQLGMEPKKVFVEPVFILEMKECMEMLANV